MGKIPSIKQDNISSITSDDTNQATIQVAKGIVDLIKPEIISLTNVLTLNENNEFLKILNAFALTRQTAFEMTNTNNDIVITTISPVNVKVSIYLDKMRFLIKSNFNSTDVCTINIDNVGIKDLKNADGSDIVDNIKENEYYYIEYDLTNDYFTLHPLAKELVSGVDIKTINNQSILGSGNIDIQAGGTGIMPDGSVAFTSNQSMGNNRLINVANAIANGDAINLAQLNDAIASITQGEIPFDSYEELIGTYLPNGTDTITITDIDITKYREIIIDINNLKFTNADDELKFALSNDNFLTKTFLITYMSFSDYYQNSTNVTSNEINHLFSITNQYGDQKINGYYNALLNMYLKSSPIYTYISGQGILDYSNWDNILSGYIHFNDNLADHRLVYSMITQSTNIRDLNPDINLHNTEITINALKFKANSIITEGVIKLIGIKK